MTGAREIRLAGNAFGSHQALKMLKPTLLASKGGFEDSVNRKSARPGRTDILRTSSHSFVQCSAQLAEDAHREILVKNAIHFELRVARRHAASAAWGNIA